MRRVDRAARSGREVSDDYGRRDSSGHDRVRYFALHGVSSIPGIFFLLFSRDIIPLLPDFPTLILNSPFASRAGQRRRGFLQPGRCG